MMYTAMLSKLQELGNRLGLAAVGVAPATEEVLHSYPWARSVVVAAISYLPPEREIDDDTLRGWVARVARSVDYHTVLRDKLVPLAGVVESKGGRWEVCVDTSPLPERKLAVLGGIAWRGKNGNVFVEGRGSWVALGEIVTDLALSAPEPLDVDGCGECTRCMEACPTGAIVAPGRIDRSKCLSGLTQMSGMVPPEFREAMGNRVYGCDACQEVCPRNEGVISSSPEFARDVFPGARPELIPLIALSADRFAKTVKDSSIGWIGRTRIRRNAAIAAGNIRCERAAPALTETLRDGNAALKESAAWALRRIGSKTPG